MKWKLRPSGVFLFLTLLHCALCNHHSGDKHGKKKNDHSTHSDITKVARHNGRGIPGLAITQLDDLSFLDPYNLIDGKSFSSSDKASILHEIIPMSKTGQSFPEKKHKRTKHKNILSNSSKYSIVENLKDPEKSTSLLSHFLSTSNRGRKLPAHFSRLDNGDDRNSSQKNKSTKVDDDFYHLDYDDMHDFGKNFEGTTQSTHRKKSAYTRIEKDRNALLHEAVRKLLGFSSSPDPIDESGRLLPDPTKEKRLPRYVKDLYERFQSGEMNAGLVNGNTVRSLHTNHGLIDGKSMFLFNLSSLRPSEELLNAEVHLYRRKLKPWIKRLEVEVVLYQVAPHYISQVGKITIRDSSSGWQWYDVTNAVRSCLATRDPRPHLFGLTFQARRPNGKTRTMPLRKFGRHHSMPFLVVYSNETEAVSFEQLDLLAERLRARHWDETDHDTDTVIDKEKKKKNNSGTDESNLDRKNDDTDDELTTKDNLYTEDDLEFDNNVDTHIKPKKENDIVDSVSLTNDLIERRRKRSIFTNEIPEDPIDYEKQQKYNLNIPKTHPGILQARKESRIQIGDSGLIPFPDHHLQQRRRRRKNRRRKHRKRFPNRGRRLRFPKEWEDFQESLVAKAQPENSNICSRKKLVVDFADIGWGDWIISPKSFQAYYCAGECPFPLTKRLSPSNHATIQSIVHAVGIYDNVPAPCCVPDVMSSVTLLYFDEDRNVVLKNYPGMTVESCACR